MHMGYFQTLILILHILHTVSNKFYSSFLVSGFQVCGLVPEEKLNLDIKIGVSVFEFIFQDFKILVRSYALAPPCLLMMLFAICFNQITIEN